MIRFAAFVMACLIGVGAAMAQDAPAPAVPLSAVAASAPPATRAWDGVGGAPLWAFALAVLLAASFAAACGVFAALRLRGLETDRRRRSVAALLTAELTLRRQAFAAIPTPASAEAGIAFVAAVLALSAAEDGFRAAQGGLDLLPARLVSPLIAHYATVRRLALILKGQSIAAGIRMMQANRIGGHPSPDPALMREIQVQLAECFQHVEALIGALVRVR
jgi:hypothetical protein